MESSNIPGQSHGLLHIGRHLLWNLWQYLVLIKMKCHNNVIPNSDVMTKITELLLTKQKHLINVLMILLNIWNPSQCVACISFVFLYILPCTIAIYVSSFN